MSEIEDRRVAEDDRRSDAYVLNALLVEAKAEVVRVRTELVVARAERDHYRNALDAAREWLSEDDAGTALGVMAAALEQDGAA